MPVPAQDRPAGGENPAGPAQAGRPHAGPAEPALVDTIASLRDELRGLRTASQLRAVIEQAKGVLVERHGISLEEAFDRLRETSQQHNARLVEVAATIVGVAVPDAADWVPDLPEEVVRSRIPTSPSASRTWRELQEQPDVRAGVVSALVDSVAAATAHGDEAAQLLAEVLGGERVAAVSLYRTAADESLRLVGSWGVPGDAISSWRSIPPSPDIPYVHAVQQNQAHFWPDRARRAEEFPSVRGLRTDFEATAVVPVADAGSVVGVVGLMWTDAQAFDEPRTSAISGVVRRVAPLLLRDVATADPELEWLNTLLRLHLDPWLLLAMVPTADGIVRDFVVQDAAEQLGAEQWLGRRLVELWPVLADDGMTQALAGLAHTGGSWTMTVGIASDTPWGSAGCRVRAVRLGARIVLVWRPAQRPHGRTD